MNSNLNHSNEYRLFIKISIPENEFVVNEATAGIEVAIKNAAHIQKIFHIFKTHGIDCGIADIVDQVYQG